jgi:hypothetical protein
MTTADPGTSALDSNRVSSQPLADAVNAAGADVGRDPALEQHALDVGRADAREALKRR